CVIRQADVAIHDERLVIAQRINGIGNDHREHPPNGIPHPEMHQIGSHVPMEQLRVKGACYKREQHYRCQQPQQSQSRSTVTRDNIEPTGVRPELGIPQTLAELAEQSTHSSAFSRSTLRSSIDSTPTLNLTSSSPSPSSRLRSTGTLACVITAGWFTRLSTPPSDSARVNSFVRSQNRLAAS